MHSNKTRYSDTWTIEVWLVSSGWNTTWCILQVLILILIFILILILIYILQWHYHGVVLYKIFRKINCVWLGEERFVKMKYMYNNWVHVTCHGSGRDVTMVTWLWCSGDDIHFSRYSGMPFPANVDGIHQMMRQNLKDAWHNRKLSSWAVGTWI